MKHAPATMSGLKRKRIVREIENVIVAAFMFGALYIFCAFVTVTFSWMGVN